MCLPKRSLTLPVKKTVDLAFHHRRPHNLLVHNVSHLQRPAVVNIHGILGTGAIFHSISKTMADELNADVYSVDLRNHGSSPRAAPYDLVTLTADIVQFIEKHIGTTRPVSLLGFSIGGKLGLLASLCNRINIQRCISIDLPPYNTPTMDPILLQNYDLIMKILHKDIKILRGSDNWKKNVLSLFQQVPANKGNGGDPALYFANGFHMVKLNNAKPAAHEDPYISYCIPLEKMPNFMEELKIWPQLSDPNVRGDLLQESTDRKVMIIRCMKSCFVNDDYSLITNIYPNAIIKEFDNGHNILMENPKGSMQCILDFFKSVK